MEFYSVKKKRGGGEGFGGLSSVKGNCKKLSMRGEDVCGSEVKSKARRLCDRCKTRI